MMGNFKESIFQSPLILSPKEDLLSHHPVIYDIHILQGNMNISIWNRKKIVKSHSSEITFFEQHIGMSSGYLRTATDRCNYVKSAENQEGDDYDFLSMVIEDVGEEIWRFIHHDQQGKTMWEFFIQLVMDSQKTGVIFINGKGITTWPVECMAESRKDELNGLQFSILKSNIEKKNERINWLEWLQSKLPRKIVVLAGPNNQRYSISMGNSDELNIEKEIQHMYEQLYPFDIEEDFRSFKFYGKRTKKNPVSPYELFYLPDSSKPDDLESVIASFEEPYIFIFSGHGFHQYGSTVDGQLYWPQKDQIKEKEFFSHTQLRKVLFENPPCITIFNCCSTMRTADVRGYPERKFQPMENVYQSILSKHNEPFRLIFANRSATLDKSSMHISQSVANHMVNNNTLFDLLESFSLVKLQNSDIENERLKVLIKRDKSIGTTLMF